MSNSRPSPLAIWNSILLSAMLTAPTWADYTVQDNIAFNARKINPYTGGPAFELPPTERKIFEDLSIRADIPPLNANPLGIALEALFGISLPEIVKLQVGATLAGRTNVSVGYYVTAGRLDISYPASSSLNFQTLPGTTNVVRANDSFRVDGVFQPGVSQRTVLPQFFETEGGAGYFTIDPLRSQTAYQEPWFETQSPWASAWIDASADIQAGVHTKASVLFGLKSWRKDFRGGGQVGGRLVEIDPNGLWVAGSSEPVVDFNIFEPIGPIPIPAVSPIAELTFQVPNLAVSSGPQSGAVIHARQQQPLMTLTGNLEKLIPFIGPILQNSIGPLEYDLLNLAGGPQIELYQDMTFTPDPKVRLTFSEPVLFGNDPVPDFEREFDLDDDIHWTPMFSNSSSITVKPTYLLNNTFSNETGLAVSLLVDVEALSLTADFPPFNGTLGPIYNHKITVPLFDGELFEKNFNIPLGSVQGGSIPGIGPITTTGITFQKLNLDIEFGLGDLKFDDAVFLEEDEENPGYEIYNLSFSRSVEGGAPRLYQAQVSGLPSYVTWNGETDSDFFEALNDVILLDPVTGEPINVGRKFCTSGCNLSRFQPEESPSYVDPNPALGSLYVNTLPDDLTNVPGVDLDPTGHPVLDQYSSDGDYKFDDSVEYATEIIDLRDGASTTILARTGDFVPEGDAELDSFSQDNLPAKLFNSGEAVFIARNAAFFGDGPPRGFYVADGTAIETVVRDGDPIPSGAGTVSLGEITYRANDVGQIAFGRNEVFRDGPEGLVEIALPQQSPPDGNGTFSLVYPPDSINNLGQVAFRAQVFTPATAVEDAIYVGDGGDLTKIARAGDSAPGFTTPFFSFFESSLNDSGQVAFTAATPFFAEVGVFVGDGNTIEPIVVSADAPAGGGDYANFYGPQINSVGEVAFGAIITPTTPGPSIFAIYKSDGPTLTEIARSDVSGGFLTSPLINDVGDVAFVGSDVPRIFLHSNDSTEVIAQEGQSVSDGTAIIQTETFPHMLLNDQGHVAFGVQVFVTAENQSRQGLYVHDGTEVVEVALEGQLLAGSVITSLFLYDGPTSPFDINDEMQVVYRAALANGREVIARFEPQMYWRNAGSGSWSADANWSLNFTPREPYDVFIVAESELTVTGPAVNRTVKSLSIGGDDTATATLDLTSGTTLTATNGTTIRANGVLSGEGTLVGNVSNLGGTVSPGDSPGVLHVDGDYVQDSLGLLMLEIGGLSAGNDYDVLNVSGDVLLDGDVILEFLGGYIPAAGSQFNLLRFGGSFDATQATFYVAGAPDGLQYSAFARDGVFGLEIAAVPEPPAIVILFMGMMVMCARRRTSRQCRKLKSARHVL